MSWNPRRLEPNDEPPSPAWKASLEGSVVAERLRPAYRSVIPVLFPGVRPACPILGAGDARFRSGSQTRVLAAMGPPGVFDFQFLVDTGAANLRALRPSRPRPGTSGSTTRVRPQTRTRLTRARWMRLHPSGEFWMGDHARWDSDQTRGWSVPCHVWNGPADAGGPTRQVSATPHWPLRRWSGERSGRPSDRGPIPRAASSVAG